MRKTHKFDIEDKRNLIREEIQRVAKELSKTPTQAEFKRKLNKKVSYGQIRYFYGNWTKAVRDAGLVPNPLKSPPTYQIKDGDLINEFINVSNRLEKLPSMNEFRVNSQYSYKPYVARYGAWSKAVKNIVGKYGERFNFAIRLKTARKKIKLKKKLSKKEKQEIIINEIKQIAQRLNKTPTQGEFEKLNKTQISYHQIRYLYGTWSKAVESAGLKPNLSQQPPTYQIYDKDLIEEFIKVSNKLQKIPTMAEFTVESKYSCKPYCKRYGKWRCVLENMVKKYSHRFSFKLNPISKLQTKKGKRKRLKFDCLLKWEPRNEIETIALFVILAGRMGFEIESMQADFPDVRLTRDEKTIDAEFEYTSSNYLIHGHPIKKDCICICWRKDVEIKGLEIISLEKYTRNKEK